jgi:hypothetical protein
MHLTLPLRGPLPPDQVRGQACRRAERAGRRRMMPLPLRQPQKRRPPDAQHVGERPQDPPRLRRHGNERRHPGGGQQHLELLRSWPGTRHRPREPSEGTRQKRQPRPPDADPRPGVRGCLVVRLASGARGAQRPRLQPRPQPRKTLREPLHPAPGECHHAPVRLRHGHEQACHLHQPLDEVGDGAGQGVWRGLRHERGASLRAGRSLVRQLLLPTAALRRPAASPECPVGAHCPRRARR